MSIFHGQFSIVIWKGTQVRSISDPRNIFWIRDTVGDEPGFNFVSIDKEISNPFALISRKSEREREIERGGTEVSVYPRHNILDTFTAGYLFCVIIDLIYANIIV